MSKVRIHIHSKRRRLCDADGISAKAIIDGIVLAGILKDDSAEFVQEVTYSQEKCKYDETIITVEPINGRSTSSLDLPKVREN